MPYQVQLTQDCDGIHKKGDLKVKKLLKGLIVLVCFSLMTACSAKTTELKIGQAFYAAHGTKSFATATVVMNGDKILLAYIDEYQYLDGTKFTGVPNSENMTAYIKDGYVLGSKRVNNAAYSANMKTAANATTEIAANYNAIQAYVVGKTVKDLTDLTAKTKEEVTDAVSGATLVDTSGYLKAIVEAANAATTTAKYKGDLKKLVLNQVDGAAHGTKSFAVTTVLTDGTKVVLSYIDEFQYFAADKFTGVPNSESFTTDGSIKTGYVLGSKRVNAVAYSENMKTNGGATVAIDANFNAIQSYADGKTITDIETLSKKTTAEVTDAISTATLTDSPNYLAEIVKAAQSTK